MLKRKKAMLGLVFLCVMMLMIVGCGETNEDVKAETESQVDQGDKAEEVEEIVIRIAGFGGVDQAIVEDLLAEFVNPQVAKEGITVRYEPVAGDYLASLINSLSAGTAADLFYMDSFWAQNLIGAGQVAPLDSFLSESDILRKEHIIPALIDGFSYDGRVYGIAKDFNTLPIIFNKDLFDVAGVDYPNENDTWETLEEKLAEVVAAFDGEVTGITLQPEYARMGVFAYAAGWEPFANGKTNLLDPAFKEAFAWYTGLNDKGLGAMPADLGQGWGGGAFATGKVAVTVEGSWIIGFLRDEAPNLRYGASLLPLNPRTNERGNFIFTVAWGINAESENKDAAFKVMEALTSPEAQQWVLERGLAIPSRIELADNPYFKEDSQEARTNKVVFQGATSGNVRLFSFKEYGGEWMDPINVALAEVMSGQKTVEEALKTAQERLDVVMGE
ncbi:MAG: ABC transporter substrate-binding protein [Alkaliphilus sp.]